MMRSIFSIMLILLAGCGTNPDKPYSDTPTSGKAQMAADETLLPLVKAQVDTFHGLYRYANINMFYRSEDDIFNLLLSDSAKVIVATRKLNNKEEAYFKSRNLIPVTTKVAIDALAIIVNKNNPHYVHSISHLYTENNG